MIVNYYGNEFQVNEGVLPPSPQTVKAMEYIQSLEFRKEPTIIDVGCGTGVLGITAGLILDVKDSVIFTDTDQKALDNTKDNASRYGVSGESFDCDLLDLPVERHIDVVLAHLPFQPESYKLRQKSLKTAVYGGKTGMELYTRLWNQISRRKQKPKHVITISLNDQLKKMDKLADKAGYMVWEQGDYVSHYVKR